METSRAGDQDRGRYRQRRGAQGGLVPDDLSTALQRVKREWERHLGQSSPVEGAAGAKALRPHPGQEPRGSPGEKGLAPQGRIPAGAGWLEGAVRTRAPTPRGLWPGGIPSRWRMAHQRSN